MLTLNEQTTLEAIREKFTALCRYLAESAQPPNEDLDGWFKFIAGFHRLQGNLSIDQSFVATLLAKQYLLGLFPTSSLDAADKPQGAPGLDIDIVTDEGQRIIGEIKTTMPYAIERNDLGAHQRTSFRNDFEKLNREEADHKFFLVTDRDTYDIVRAKYATEIPGVEIVLLTKESAEIP